MVTFIRRARYVQVHKMFHVAPYVVGYLNFEIPIVLWAGFDEAGHIIF